MNKQQVPTKYMEIVAGAMQTLGYEANIWRDAPTFEVGCDRKENRGEYHHRQHHIKLATPAMKNTLTGIFAHEIAHSLQFFNSPSELSKLEAKGGGYSETDARIAYILDRYEVEARMVEVALKHSLTVKDIENLRRVYRADWIISFLTTFGNEINFVRLAKFPAWVVKMRLVIYLAVRGACAKKNKEAIYLLTRKVYQEMGW